MPQKQISPHLKRPFANDLEKILFDETTIQNRVCALGTAISAAYKGRELTVIAIVNGAVIFTADLIRELNLAIRLDCIRVSSYRNQTTPVHSPEIIDRIRLKIEGTDVLLIDDILDTGNTLSIVSKTLWTLKPASLKTCVLLDKKVRRTVDFEADFVGFDIPDEFVVGYGLDFAESYRQIPCIGVLKKDLHTT
ncbi:MAG: hypoxanthine phosphoribosyltransferase [Lentimonas sp.]